MIGSIICLIFGCKPIKSYYRGDANKPVYHCKRCKSILGTWCLPAPWPEPPNEVAKAIVGETMDFSIYDDKYYLTGRESGRSLYTAYTWKPALTLPMCRRIAEVLGMSRQDTVLDFGCARGYVVKAFRMLGFQAWGIDASTWAIYNCDRDVAAYVESQCQTERDFDWVLAKDVLEHIPDTDLQNTIDNLLTHARKGVFVVVPLSPSRDEPYVVPEYEMDVTHCQRRNLTDWASLFMREGFCVTACYLVPGIKDNYAQHAQGNGFLTIGREIEAS